MAPLRYQWPLFDADGTLFNLERAESIALSQTFQSIGVLLEPAWLHIYQRINLPLWQAVERGELKPSFVKAHRFELLLETLHISHSPAAFSAYYLQCLADCSELMDNADEVLRALGSKYHIAILTNGLKEVQRGRLTRSIIRQHISAIIISEEIGFAKPAKEFFDVAFARLGNPSKREVLMIGDGWASDIQGAVQYGIDACWYNPGHKPRPSCPAITHEIPSLRELIDWLR